MKLWCAPHAIDRIGRGVKQSKGLGTATFFPTAAGPMPSCPNWLSPQVYNWPPLVKTKQWSSPQAIWITLTIPNPLINLCQIKTIISTYVLGKIVRLIKTYFGVFSLSKSWLWPSCPWLLEPQENTFPHSSLAKQWLAPQLMALMV